ncbi:MAG TPA: radical SAM protein [Burkholderiales bacterium]|nr:radical SAM protein [Burkholderiales bacterium]
MAAAQDKTRRVLTRSEHSRDSAGLLYVYPVVSRRAGGVSIGINLNPNNACNWRCVYCQVPDLRRGRAPRVDLARLESELRDFLEQVLRGPFMQERVPAGARRLNDIAISGNGEPTTSRQFPEVIDLVGRLRGEAGVPPRVKLVLITNGSMAGRSEVQAGIARMAQLNGEVWFKVDSATREGMLRVNGVRGNPEMVLVNLRAVVGLCPTWIQTCVFSLDGAPPDAVERAAYLEFVERCARERLPLQGVLLYGLARPSMQPEAARLAPLPVGWLEDFAREIKARGVTVRVTP